MFTVTAFIVGTIIRRLGDDKKSDEIVENHRNKVESVAKEKTIPLSVNYFFTRQCNYKCGFCFHTAKTSFVLPLNEALKGMKMLADEGMKKINFSGGEPFLKDNGNFLGQLVKYCKEELKLQSVTVISNGSLITEEWFIKYGEYLDILAVSCDSFDAEVNRKIGRFAPRKTSHLNSLRSVREWCTQYKVAFKLNTVVNTYNVNDNMIEEVEALNPVRWKVFQCLLIDGENVGENAIRNAQPFIITDDQFKKFLDRHASVKCLIPEDNNSMRSSYLLIDEYMRFLNGSTKTTGKSLLDVGVQLAMNHSDFDECMFLKRGGIFKWSKEDLKLEW